MRKEEFITLVTNKVSMKEQKSGCLICRNEIIYLQTAETGKCIYCKKDFTINERCINGHYICDKCHSSGAMDIIEEFCLNTELQNPIEIANTLMMHPSVKMHGPEHHYLVPAALLTAYYNCNSIENVLDVKLNKARNRAEKVPGGFCGSHGNCGAGVGTGIFISLITEATPLSKNEWQLSNLMTAESLMSIAKHGGPRCCKRDTYLAIIKASDFVKEHFNINFQVEGKINCNFTKYNKECLLEECTFYSNHN